MYPPVFSLFFFQNVEKVDCSGYITQIGGNVIKYKAFYSQGQCKYDRQSRGNRNEI